MAGERGLLCEMCGVVNDSQVIRKMDSGCSRCMSGVRGRLVGSAPDVDISNVVISGFSKSAKSTVDSVGINADGKLEYFVKAMPENLVLLSANEYARDGAVVLYGEAGYVYKLSDKQKHNMHNYMKQHTPCMTLAVRNRTYDVVDICSTSRDVNSDSDSVSVSNSISANYMCDNNDVVCANGKYNSDSCDCVMYSDSLDVGMWPSDCAYSANTFFNTKVNVSNAEERILVYLMSGLSLKDMHMSVKHSSITGLHPEVTTSALNRFAHKWGNTPDAYQLGRPSKEGNRKGYLSRREPLERVGQYVEMDFMECDYNERVPVNDAPVSDVKSNGLLKPKKAAKLATHGGAIAGNVWVDAYSGYVSGELVKRVAKPIDIVQRCVQTFALANHKVEVFAADSGVSSQSMFQVFTPQVDGYLLKEKIKSVRSEPYNHSNGTPHVENVIKPIMTRIRMATQYILNNPNFGNLGMTEEHVLRLWGELFYWAINVINLSECVNVPGKTKHEVFTGEIPNIQLMRLLPIFCIVMVYRNTPTAASVGNAKRSFYQYGLYCGCDMKVKGGIRVAIMTNSRLSIVVTTKYKGVSDGGGMDNYAHVDRGLERVLNEPPAVTVSDVYEEVLPDDDNNNDDKNNDDTNNDNYIDNDNHVDVLEYSDDDKVVPTVHSVAPTLVTHSVQPTKVRGESSTVVQKNSNVVESVPVRMNKNSKVLDRSKWGSREERMALRNSKRGTSDERADFCDWSTYDDISVHYSFSDHTYYVVSNDAIDESHSYLDVVYNEESNYAVPNDVPSSVGTREYVYKVVTEGVPKNFSLGLKDPEWGDPCRTEWSGLIDMKTLVQVERRVADEDIRNGADVVVLFPIYEVKIKEGREVKKVRLVCNGKTQRHAGATYAPTPTKEELLVLLHMCAKFGWDYCHVDEIRAFLNAPYRGTDNVYAKLRGDPNYYKILGALYGLKTSPRHYNANSAERLIKMGFKRLHMCSCIFVKYFDNGDVVFVYAFVDDYVPCGNNRHTTTAFVDEFMRVVKTTPPQWNATSILGMTIVRDWDKCTIQISLANKICELGDKHDMMKRIKKEVPIPSNGYIVNDNDFDNMKNNKAADYLSIDDVKVYMQIVGSLIWIGGIRMDIHYGLMYLTWFTKKPRVHHMSMAYYLMSYLYYSKDVPLVLGGSGDMIQETYFDSSWGTGPKGRSICAVLTRLGKDSACIVAKTTASASTVSMSSFESELETCTLAMKTSKRIKNILDELNCKLVSKPVLYNDNEAMINFVKGEGMASGARHMELRMWYVREQYAMGSVDLLHMPGTVLPADRLTKPSTKQEQAEFTKFVMGLSLM